MKLFVLSTLLSFIIFLPFNLLARYTTMMPFVVLVWKMNMNGKWVSKRERWNWIVVMEREKKYYLIIKVSWRKQKCWILKHFNKKSCHKLINTTKVTAKFSLTAAIPTRSWEIIYDRCKTTQFYAISCINECDEARLSTSRNLFLSDGALRSHLHIYIL